MTAELEQDDELTEVVTELAREHRVPGLAAGVLHAGRAHAVTLGVTSTRDPLPVDADTLFFIGSTSKTLTGTALMRLVDEGRATLKDRVVDHLPGFAAPDEETTRSVTLGQLLNHTAGWRGDTLPPEGFGEEALAQGLSVVAEGPQEYPAGAHASYNNAALLVAGRVVEQLAGTSFEKAVTDLVLAPLGMDGTFFLPWEVAHRRLAEGHVLHPDREQPLPAWPVSRAMGPAGGALSTLRDQLRWAAYHLDGSTEGTPPLAEETRLLMQQPTVGLRSTLSGVGLTWLLADHGGVRLVSHGGNLSNLHTSAFHLAPDHGLAVVVMGNSGGATAVGKELLAWAVQYRLQRPPRPALPTLPLPPSLVEEYVGTYDLGAWALAVTSEDGRLFVQMVLPEGTAEELKVLFDKPPTEMVVVGPDQLAPAADPVQPTGDFVRDSRGAVTWFRSGMRMARRV